MSDTNYYDVIDKLDINCQNIDEDFTNILPVLDLEIPDLLIADDDDDDDEDPIDFSNTEEIWSDIGLDPSTLDGLNTNNNNTNTTTLPQPINIMLSNEVLPRNALPPSSG